jgi:hypothetical protein
MEDEWLLVAEWEDECECGCQSGQGAVKPARKKVEKKTKMVTQATSSKEVGKAVTPKTIVRLRMYKSAAYWLSTFERVEPF